MTGAPSVRVLLVDDDELTREGVAMILSSEPGLDVVGQAADAPEAYTMIEDLAPDVVLMDVQLPGVDGIEATRRITAASGNGTPRVIVLTTFDLDVYAYRSMLAGASGFLLKRVPAEDLIDAVRAVADGNALPLPERTTDLISRYATIERKAPRFLPALTDRETEVLVLLARGLSNEEIARELSVSVETVRTHVKHVYAKAGARDRAQAVIAAYESGLVGPHPEG
jgi:DNA-binding NarL/FixJ family response regulator